MNNRELAMVINNSNKNVNAYETIDAIVKAGFKNVFIQWYNKDWEPTQEEQLKYVREKGLNIIFAHLGYKNINDIWVEGENGDILVDNYKNDIKICKNNDISMVIMHLIGGNVVPEYSELGLKRIQEIVDYAESLNVKIAFENTKRKEYLYYVLDNIKNKNVGACFDSGHYHVFSNDDFDWSKFKDRIFSIHLHDNDKSDDLHLMPFDGTLNWEDVIKKLIENNYDGPITMELCYRYNYLEMGIEEFYKRAYEVGKRLQYMFNFSNNLLTNTISKDDIAKLLSTSPEALDAFEKAYSINVLDNNCQSENIFDINSRQATNMNNEIKIDESQQLKDIKKRIVNELLAKASVWTFDGKAVSINNNINHTIDKPVTNEEIRTIPKNLRPQLTGSLMKVDINEPSHIVLLDYYWHFINEEDLEKKKYYYHLFRQGLDILDLDEITRLMIATNKNSMGHWLPQITQAALATGTLKVPKTTIVKVPTTMLQLTRCDYGELTRTTMDIVNDFCLQAFDLKENQEYFIKTGTYSSKFDFRNAYVHDPKEVREIGEYLLFIHYQALLMASPLAKPIIYGVSTTDEWVVREFIKDTENNPCIYKGLPLHTEYRVFVDFDTKEIIGMSPYWEPNTMKKRFGHEEDANSPHNIHDYVIYSMHEPILMKRYEQYKNQVKKFVQELISHTDDISGQWSIDIMQNGNDFWIIDMAIAETSAFYDCVPKSLRKRLPENWLPTIK